MQRRGLTPLCQKIQGAHGPDGDKRSQRKKAKERENEEGG